MELRVNYGSEDWHVNMSLEDFEKELKSGKDLIELPLLLFGEPHAKIWVRPEQIRYYLLREHCKLPPKEHVPISLWRKIWDPLR